MNRIKAIVLSLFALLLVVVLLGTDRVAVPVSSLSDGPPPGHSGAPGEPTCIACHFGGGGGSGLFTILSAPANYVPGQTYQIQVRHVNEDPTRMRWGFQLTALNQSNLAAGTFQNLSAMTRTVSANGRSYIGHTSLGTAEGQLGGHQWTFDWTAPATDVGMITFYAAGNQADGDGTNEGDQIRTTRATSAAPAGTPTPTNTPTSTPTPTATPTSTPTSTPTVTPTPQGFESDVAPRPDGDGSVLSGDVVQIRRFVVGLDSPNTTTSEYQRADSSPISTRGNGVIDATDTVQTRRYITGLDALMPVGGPTSPTSVAAREETFLNDLWRYFWGSEVKVRDAVTEQGDQVTIFVDIDGSYEWAAASFTLEFDGSVLTNPKVWRANEDSRETVVTVNDVHAAKGQLGILVDSAGRTGNVAITFDIASDAPEGETKVGFSDRLAARAVSDAFGSEIPVKFQLGS